VCVEGYYRTSSLDTGYARCVTVPSFASEAARICSTLITRRRLLKVRTRHGGYVNESCSVHLRNWRCQEFVWDVCGNCLVECRDVKVAAVLYWSLFDQKQNPKMGYSDTLFVVYLDTSSQMGYDGVFSGSSTLITVGFNSIGRAQETLLVLFPEGDRFHWLYSRMLERIATYKSWKTIIELPPRNGHQTNSVALSPQANYTDWAIATCRRNLVPTFVDRGVSRSQRGGSPTVVNLSFLDRIHYFSFK
jgi:hypothetical protein